MSRSTSSSVSFSRCHDFASEFITESSIHLRVTTVIEITFSLAFQRKASFGASALLVTSSSRRSASISADLLRVAGLLTASRPSCVMFRFRVRALLVCESNAFLLIRATRTAGIRHPGIIRIPDDAFRLSHTCRCRHHVFESFSAFRNVFLSRHRGSSAVNFASWAPCRVTKNFKVYFADMDVAGSSVVTVIRLGRSRFNVRQLWDDQHRFRTVFVNSLKIEFISSLRIEFIKACFGTRDWAYG